MSSSRHSAALEVSLLSNLFVTVFLFCKLPPLLHDCLRSLKSLSSLALVILQPVSLRHHAGTGSVSVGISASLRSRIPTVAVDTGADAAFLLI